MPTVGGARSREALEVALKVAEALPVATDPTIHPCLAQGHGGVALFFAELARLVAARDGAEAAEAHQARASEHLEAALVGFEALPFDTSFATGVPGVLWVATQTTALGVVACPEELFEDFTAQLVDDLVRRETVAAEFLYGLAGIGEYALAHAALFPSSHGARELLARTASLLRDHAIRTDAGIFWDDRAKVPYDAAPGIQLGTAHGVAGVISFLARAGALGTPGADDGAREAMRWLATQVSTSERGALVPDLAGDAEGASTLAWCHGDLGFMCSLHAYEARLASPQELEVFAGARMRIAAHAVVEPVDASVCHGAFGNAHLGFRLAKQYDDAGLRDAAEAWWRASLGAARTGAPHALYTGPLGMGLAAISVADESVTPRWDGALCVG